MIPLKVAYRLLTGYLQGSSKLTGCLKVFTGCVLVAYRFLTGCLQVTCRLFTGYLQGSSKKLGLPSLVSVDLCTFLLLNICRRKNLP